MQVPPGSPARELPLAVVKVSSGAASQQQEQENLHQGPSSASPRQMSGLASALRIRFGDLDQIELGELIGKGGTFCPSS